jgi:protein SEY1
MDVEGTDSRERGDEQVTQVLCLTNLQEFERRSALFSLAISEVIIVNMWEHQVGLYQGANMGLLKTVLEVNLQLFQKERGFYSLFQHTDSRTKERALLLFVLRDHLGTTPLSNLAETLKRDLSNIWSSLSKPPGLENCSIQDYFDFQFTALPHKILQPDSFDQEVRHLRLR